MASGSKGNKALQVIFTLSSSSIRRKRLGQKDEVKATSKFDYPSLWFWRPVSVTFRQKPIGKLPISVRRYRKMVRFGSRNALPISGGRLCLGSDRFSPEIGKTSHFPSFVGRNRPIRFQLPCRITMHHTECEKKNDCLFKRRSWKTYQRQRWITETRNFFLAE